MLNVSFAIMEANSKEYPFGKMPDGGEPKTLAPFPELELGRKRIRGTEEKIGDMSPWQFGATIDPELTRRISAWAEWSSGIEGREDALLGPGPRSLIIAAALVTRGESERAARFIRRAYDYGMNSRQVLEAISATVPMTGMVTLEIGLEAMQLAENI
jgi:alkylhydroperoxidase/carboxymuconolactone decarboxylase family protein YurZ